MIKNKINALIFAVIFGVGILQATPVCAAEAGQARNFQIDFSQSSEDVSDREYLPAVRNLIALSQQSLDISLASAAVGDDPGDPVGLLFEEIIVAEKRGVEVRLFLNTFNETGTRQSLFLRDDLLWSLRKAGAEVHFVSPSYSLSGSLLISDRRDVLEGGFVWVRDDLEKGLSSASLIHSETLAQKKITRLELMPLWDVEARKAEKSDGRVAVAVYLLRELKYFPSMVSLEDSDAFKIYLALLRIFQQVHDVRMKVRLEDMAHEIPAGEYYESGTVSFQALKTLERLAEQYQLIKIEEKGPEEISVQMIFPSASQPTIGVPVPFFHENHAKELSAAGLYTYLLILLKSQTSGESPVWLGSERNVEKDFPLSRENFRNGVEELRRRNLLEVFPFDLNKGYRKLETLEYRYLLNPIPSLSERLENWSRLREEFGDQSFKKARQLSDMIGEPEDPKVVAAYLNLLKNFRPEDVQALTLHISSLPPESTAQSMDYLRLLLERETQKNLQLSTA